MKLALWSAAVLAAVVLAVAANVLLLRTRDNSTEPLGTLSPTLVRLPAQPALRPTTTTTGRTTTRPTTTADDHGSDGTGGDHPEDD